MERKLLFFDIDGTLIPAIDAPVPESTKKALKLAQEAGHYIFINTGRPKSIVPKRLFEIGFDGYLCGCGSYAIVKDQVLLDQRFEKERCRELFLQAKEMGIPVILEGNEHCYIDQEEMSKSPIYQTELVLMNEFPGVILDACSCDEIEFSKFCCIVDSKEKLEEFMAPFSDYFDSLERGNCFYEVVPKGLSKATAIDTVLRYLNQSLEDCYAFGDSSNDVPMLRHAPNSIAMGNSDDEALKTATYITTPIKRDGIYLAMKHFGLF